jgi:hypothetical protein
VLLGAGRPECIKPQLSAPKLTNERVTDKVLVKAPAVPAPPRPAPRLTDEPLCPQIGAFAIKYSRMGRAFTASDRQGVPRGAKVETNWPKTGAVGHSG